MTPSDFAFASYFVMSMASLIASVFVFRANPGLFSWRLFIIGFIGSLGNGCGSFFATAAFATGSAAGPIVAMLNVQVILLTLLSAVRMQIIPNWLQLIALVIGIIGALILTIPDELYSIWYLLTRC
jgi:drug/metabolite transporter (DMT)-like permease